jgi:hypothetical protein
MQPLCGRRESALLHGHRRRILFELRDVHAHERVPRLLINEAAAAVNILRLKPSRSGGPLSV